MRISLDTLWSGLGVLAGSSLLNTNVLNVKLRGNFPSTTDQIKFQFWRAFEFTLDFQQRNFLHYIAADAALWNPGKYIPKVMLRVVGEEGSPLRGWRRRKWKLFFRKFSESDWHLSISSPMMRRGSGGGWRGERPGVCVGKFEGLKGGMWTSHCEIVRMWGENVRSAGFRGTPATDPVGVLIWVSRFVSRIYITIPAWQQWTAVVTILERQKKASIRHNPGSQSGGNYFRRHQVEEEVCLKPWRQARGMP